MATQIERDRLISILTILGFDRRLRRAFPDLISEGFPVSSFASVSKHTNVSRERLSFVMNSAALQRHIANEDTRLDAGESDRLFLVARIYALAEMVLGSAENARSWMNTPNRSLDNANPFDLFSTEAEAHRVEDTLGRIADGAFG
jgi:putative toxin-antitoxin system antitoxin component (TIGR02293 family)